jgi:hypothetical protein
MLEVVVSDEVVDEVEEPPFELPPRADIFIFELPVVVLVSSVVAVEAVVASMSAAKWRRVCRSWSSELRSESEMLPFGFVRVSMAPLLTVNSSQ